MMKSARAKEQSNRTIGRENRDIRTGQSGQWTGGQGHSDMRAGTCGPGLSDIRTRTSDNRTVVLTTYEWTAEIVTGLLLRG